MFWTKSLQIAIDRLPISWPWTNTSTWVAICWSPISWHFLHYWSSWHSADFDHILSVTEICLATVGLSSWPINQDGPVTWYGRCWFWFWWIVSGRQIPAFTQSTLLAVNCQPSHSWSLCCWCYIVSPISSWFEHFTVFSMVNHKALLSTYGRFQCQWSGS